MIITTPCPVPLDAIGPERTRWAVLGWTEDGTAVGVPLGASVLDAGPEVLTGIVLRYARPETAVSVTDTISVYSES